MSDLSQLIGALSRPEAYPHPVERVEVIQTHISVVFLAGERVYKLKKPLDLGFLDFSDAEHREHYCHEEVRLNRRLAPDVYLGVLPVTGPAERARIDGDGPVLEHVVCMRRLDPEHTLAALLERGELDAPLLRRLARRLAEFHAEAEAGPEIARFARFDAVARNCRQNFEQAQDQLGDCVSASVLGRLAELSEHELRDHRELIERRAASGVPRDSHGDLHLDHVYVYPQRQPPDDLLMVDCIEFNREFRYADPLADLAFLLMDLGFHGERGLAGELERSYLEASGDHAGAPLLPLYCSYRAAVRGKVEGMAVREPEIPKAEREGLRSRARAHWLYALDVLEQPRRRPALVLVGGLPGCGKSALARGLEELAGFELVSSDVERKRLAGLEPDQPAAAEFGEGLYSERWNQRTYAHLAERAERALFEGRRVLVDASFREQERREQFLRLARSHAVRSLLIVCEAPPEEIRARMERRASGPSDARWDVYQRAARLWQEPAGNLLSSLCRIATTGSKQDTRLAALAALAAQGLWEP